jgi:hypothetical protein
MRDLTDEYSTMELNYIGFMSLVRKTVKDGNTFRDLKFNNDFINIMSCLAPCDCDIMVEKYKQLEKTQDDLISYCSALVPIVDLQNRTLFNSSKKMVLILISNIKEHVRLLKVLRHDVLYYINSSKEYIKACYVDYKDPIIFDQV